MPTILSLSKDEFQILVHGLGAPASIADGLEDVYDRETVEERVSALVEVLMATAGRLSIETDLDREILAAASTESTYFCDMTEEVPIVRARITKAGNSLERKLTEAIGRDIRIPRQ